MSVLDSLVSAVQKDKDKEAAGSGGWVGALISGVIVMILAAVFGFIAWKRGKERAQLLHEKAVQEELEHQAKIDAQIAANENERQEALKKVQEAKDSLDVLAEQQKKLEETYRENRKRIDDITSWDDVDSFLGS